MSIYYSFRNASQNIPDSFEKLEKGFSHIGRLEAAYAKLERDKLTTAPSGALQASDEIMSALSATIQKEWHNPKLLHLLSEAEKSADKLDDEGHAMLREMRYAHTMQNVLKPELAAEWGDIERRGRKIQADVKASDDWETAKSWLSHVVDVKRKAGAAYAEALGLKSVYDGLLSIYSPGFTSDQLMQHFDALIPEIHTIYPEILERQMAGGGIPPLQGEFPPEQQMELNRRILKAIGFDFTRGGLYDTPYDPVEGGIPEDTRAVIKYPRTDTFLVSLKSAVHEAWHCIYTQNLPHKYRYTPLGDDLGTVKQESQALLGEMIIARTPEFLTYVAREAEDVFGRPFDPVQLYDLRTQANAGLDRKKADEVTYHLHIAARLALEEGLMNGRINVDELPQQWGNAYEYNLGIRPDNNREGVLQDVHWFVGKIGYFPSYTMGHAIAAQEYYAMRSKMPDMMPNVAQGNFSGLFNWLKENVHEKGRLMPMQELLQKATGEKLNPYYQVAHLRERYLNETPTFFRIHGPQKNRKAPAQETL